MNRNQPLLFSFLVPLGLLAVPRDAPAQVVIEGGPGVVQISDRDGKPEPVVPGGVPQGAPVGIEPNPPTAVLIDPTPPRAIELESEADPSVTVLVPVVGPVPPARVRQVAPAAAVDTVPAAPAVPVVSVDVAKRKAELVRELGIADSGTGATIAIDTEGLYEKDTVVVDSLASPTLLGLAEFIRLNPHQGVSVTYHYSPSLHGQELAWKRSLSLIEWLKVPGGLGATRFTIEEPVAVVDPAPTRETGDGAVALPRNRVVLVVDYR